MRYEFAPVEVLEVADALLFRANALGQDKREQAAHLRTLAIRFLGSAKHFKELANRDAMLALARPQLSTE